MAKLIVALDYSDKNKALALVDELDPALCAVKVGSEMFTRFGPEFVRKLVNCHFRVFLDLKFHDIPNTVAKACQAGAELGVWMLNVHASGGLKMLEAARMSLESLGRERPILIAVTILTSMHEKELTELGINKPLVNQVIHLADLARSAGLDGVVCSALEASVIKSTFGQAFLTVTPGIRMAHQNPHDQTRIITPKLATNAGCDYIVVGRAITEANDPKTVMQEILRDAG